MRRKLQPKLSPAEAAVVPVPIVPEVILDPARVFLAQDKVKTVVPCAVCGSDTTEDSSERLCWVCRRLKISAWRDSEPMPAQE